MIDFASVITVHYIITLVTCNQVCTDSLSFFISIHLFGTDLGCSSTSSQPTMAVCFASCLFSENVLIVSVITSLSDGYMDSEQAIMINPSTCLYMKLYNCCM